jgi:fructoselysine transporter
VQCAVGIVLIFATDISGLLGYFTMIALAKNAATFATIFVLRKKEGYNPAYRIPGGYIMPIIAIFMTCTLIYGELTYAPVQSLTAAAIAIVTGLPVYYFWEKKNKQQAA